tara:strand:- start:1490 stop:1591 length:102 start_codon:yes stop_codon:yes gene_type:complete
MRVKLLTWNLAGREWGEFGFEEFLEIKSVSGSF